ncbi:MAG TPA: hypothetical protein VE737_04160, partial [Actinomycetota bacterium]|nr:hypothetical protein [Actinomycetota bacterium]
MSDHTRRLDHHGQVVVLVPDLDAAPLGRHLGGRGQVGLDPFAPPEPKALRASHAVDQHRPPSEGPLDVGSRDAGQGRHHRVEAARPALPDES